MKSLTFCLLSIVLLVMVLLSTVQAQANLEVLGTDSLGRQLIYDHDLNITWYDFQSHVDTWQNMVDWAAGLSVNFGGNDITGWRLPVTYDQSCVNEDCTNSELGHLWYTTLENPANAGAHGTINTGPFQDLIPGSSWSGTTHTNPAAAWTFDLFNGFQSAFAKATHHSAAAAVIEGRVVVPEPISSTLFIVGGATLGFRRFRKRFKK